MAIHVCLAGYPEDRSKRFLASAGRPMLVKLPVVGEQRQRLPLLYSGMNQGHIACHRGLDGSGEGRPDAEEVRLHYGTDSKLIKPNRDEANRECAPAAEQGRKLERQRDLRTMGFLPQPQIFRSNTGIPGCGYCIGRRHRCGLCRQCVGRLAARIDPDLFPCCQQTRATDHPH